MNSQIPSRAFCHGTAFDYNNPTAGPAQNADEVAPLAEQMIVYTHPDCTYSEALKDELREAGTVYEEINLALKPDQWPKVEELTGGERITPVTVQDGEVSVGFHGVG